MGDTPTPLDVAAKREFLAGLFSTWYASEYERTKPNAQDKKYGAALAHEATASFGYHNQRRKRADGTWVEPAARAA